MAAGSPRSSGPRERWLPRPASGVVLAAATRPRRRICRRFFGRNDRQEQVGLLVAAEMQAGDAAKDVRRPVAGVVVQEWSAARELVLEVRQLAPARTAIDVVLAADAQADTATGRNHDRGRPDLDVELRHLALLERLRLVVAVVGPVGRGEFLVELAVRGAQPSLTDRGVRVDGA